MATGERGGPNLFMSLKRHLSALSNRKAVLKRNDGGFSIEQQDEAFRIIYKPGLRLKFRAL